MAIVCWSRDSVEPILSIEALAPDESVFLATHSPFSELTVDQNGIADLGGAPNEEKLFEVLSSANRRHALCVIEGEPGSGKSHLIRWLSVKWNRYGRKEDVPLLIARADGSLEGTLRRLNDALVGLGVGSGELQGLSQLSEITLEARAQLFRSMLALSFGRDFFVNRRDDAEWCASLKLNELFANPAIVAKWHAPDRILRILSGHGSHSDRRDSEVGAFTLDDVRDLTRAMQYAQGRSPVHIRLKADLQKESEIPSAELTDHSISLQLLRALNMRLNPAVQRFLGISPDDLKNAFRRVRRLLRKQGNRLVLLLEDITNFQGVDEALFDVLITDSAMVPEECDLVSIVGVTPGYLRENIRGRGNYLQRFTHHVRLSEPASGGDYQSVRGLQAPESQVRFASRYLNAVRLGVETVKEHGDKVPNACDTCLERPTCHEAFGQVDGIGLFPLTKRFIAGNFDRLEDPSHLQTVKTPRGLLQGLLAPTLVQAPELAKGQFPDSRLKGALLPHAGRVDAVTEDRIANITDKARLRLFLSLWSVSASIDSTVPVAEAIFERFSLPSIQPSGAQVVTKPTVPVTGPQKKSELEIRQAQLSNWKEGAHLEDESEWRAIVTPHLKRFTFTTPYVPALGRQRLLTEHTWTFARTGRTTPDYFVLDSEDWVTKGLEAALVFRIAAKQKTMPQEFIVRSRQMGAFLSGLQRKVQEHLQRRWAAVCATPEPWDPARSAVQLLAWREFLDGRVKVLDSSLSWWQKLMGPSEPLPTTQRSKQWTDLLERLSLQADLRRGRVSDLMRLPVGSETRDSDPFDGAVAVRALRSLTEKDHLPSDTLHRQPDLPNNLSGLIEIGQTLHATSASIADVVTEEWRTISDASTDSMRMLRSQSIAGHLRRIDSVVSTVSRHLPTVEPGQVSIWKQTMSHAAAMGLRDDSSPETRVLEGFMENSSKVKPGEESRAELLTRCQQAPAAELRLLQNVLSKGEAIVRVLIPHVEATVAGGDLDETAMKKVNKLGSRLNAAGEALRR